MSVMDQLVAERKRQGLSQAYVAERLKVTQACISRWESGRARLISLEDAEAYASVLGIVSLGDLRPVQVEPVSGTEKLEAALNAFPETDERHWQVQAYLFNLLAHRALERADEIRRKGKRGGL